MCVSKLTVWFVAVVLCCAASVSGGAAAAEKESGLGNKVCLSCHDGKNGKLEVPGVDGA